MPEIERRRDNRWRSRIASSSTVDIWPNIKSAGLLALAVISRDSGASIFAGDAREVALSRPQCGQSRPEA